MMKPIAAMRRALAPSSVSISVAALVIAIILTGPSTLFADESSASAAAATTDHAAPVVDRAAAIAAAHRKLDDELLHAMMSPFTASAAYYIEAGKTARIGADEKTTVMEPATAMPSMAAVTYAEGAFWIEPVSGAAPPSVRGTTENGDVAPSIDAPISQKKKLGDGEVLALKRFLLEMSPQSGMGRVLVYDPESPMKKAFTGLKWFEPSPAFQIKAVFKPNPSPEKVTVGTSRGLKKEYYRVGTFEFTVEGKPQKLTALWISATPKAGDGFFVPFTDATTGRESYEVGRYLDVKYEGPGAEHVIDFNKAGNPNCNYSPHYNCPIPPKENALSVAIRAGEKTYPTDPHP